MHIPAAPEVHMLQVAIIAAVATDAITATAKTAAHYCCCLCIFIAHSADTVDAIKEAATAVAIIAPAFGGLML
jgi:hypothetical protein